MLENNIKSVIEALLFASEKPLAIEQVRNVLDNLEAIQVRRILEELKSEYEKSNRGMRIIEIAGGFQMISAPDFVSFLKKLFKERHADRLSKPALETLAIIAYKQPVTKLHIQSPSIYQHTFLSILEIFYYVLSLPRQFFSILPHYKLHQFPVHPEYKRL